MEGWIKIKAEFLDCLFVHSFTQVFIHLKNIDSLGTTVDNGDTIEIRQIKSFLKELIFSGEDRQIIFDSKNY